MITGIPSVITAPLFSFAATFFITLWLIKGNSLKILDYPNARSLHTHPIPRTGGVGLMIGILLAWLLFSATLPISVWLGVSLLAIISFADDISGMPVWGRLLAHTLVATLFSVFYLVDMHGWIVVFLVVIATIWASNLYNFMDGSDGLAGGMTVIGFGCYGLVSFLADNHAFATINFTIAAAAMAFLLHNFHPARIFMGDAGAIPLGFLAAALGVLGWVEGLWSWCFPLLVFSPFIADASITLSKRALRHEKIWQAHREHYYQRIIQSGFGHRNTALSSYALMLAVSASAVWVYDQDILMQCLVGVVWISVYLISMFFFDRYQKSLFNKG
jgi:UDP-GlcNAc:undecaprenyl-phosphate GlcNAc-1-phosphate transferase